METLYKIKDWKIVYLNDLLEEKEKEKEVDLSIFEKFKQKYWNKVLNKEALWLCNIENIYFFILILYDMGTQKQI